MHSTVLTKNFERRFKPSKPLVLIVDNDPDNLLLASCVIETLGMNYLITDNSEECLGLIYKFKPDLVLLDIVMPKLNGLEITRIIKQDKNMAHILVIAVTGLTQSEDKTQLIEAGCDDYLSKPYLIEDLESKVCQHLNKDFEQKLDSE